MSLGVNYNLLREEIADYLGFGRVSGGWDADKLERIAAALSHGLRQFYWPPGLPIAHDPRKPKPPDVVRTHEWSFLRQAGTLSLVSGTATYALPANFNLMVGRLTGVGLRPIPLIDEDDMRAKLSTEPPNAKPLYAAITDVAFDATIGSRKQLVFVPTPNAAFTVGYRYSIVPEVIDATDIYPLGGVEHGETILQSCLAAAELRLHDAPGPHYQRFMERLQASVRLDMGGGQ